MIDLHPAVLVAVEAALAERTPRCPVVVNALRGVQQDLFAHEVRAGRARPGQFETWRAARPATTAIEGEAA